MTDTTFPSVLNKSDLFFIFCWNEVHVIAINVFPFQDTLSTRMQEKNTPSPIESHKKNETIEFPSIQQLFSEESVSLCCISF